MAAKVVTEAKIAENLAEKTIDPTKPLSKIEIADDPKVAADLAAKVVTDVKIAENLAEKIIDQTKPVPKIEKKPSSPILANPATPNSTETTTAALLANTSPNLTEVAAPTFLGDITIPNPTEAITPTLPANAKLPTQQQAQTPVVTPVNPLAPPQLAQLPLLTIPAQPIGPPLEVKEETLSAEEIKSIISEAVKDEITTNDSVSSEDLHKIISEEIDAMDSAKADAAALDPFAPDSGSGVDEGPKEAEKFDLEQLKTIMASEIKSFMDKEKSDRKKELEGLEKQHEKAIDAQKTSLDKKIKSQEEALKATNAKHSKANQDRLEKARAKIESALKHKKNLELSLETLSSSKKKLERLKRITKLHLSKTSSTITKLEKPETNSSPTSDLDRSHLLGLRNQKLKLMTSLEKLDRSTKTTSQEMRSKIAALKKILPPDQFSLWMSQNSPKNKLKFRLTKLLTVKFQIFRKKKTQSKKQDA